jgi:methanogenic corrinoid protein MtbC1
MAIAVIEDYHMLGKRIIYTVLRASGFELLDYGHGINTDDLADRVIEDKIEILLISALMLPAALKVKELREKLNKLNCNVKIVVGGAPFRFDNKLWQEVGSDATGKDSSEAIKIITDLIKGGKPCP